MLGYAAGSPLNQPTYCTLLPLRITGAPGIGDAITGGPGVAGIDDILVKSRYPRAAGNAWQNGRDASDCRRAEDAALEVRADDALVHEAVANLKLATRMEHSHARARAGAGG